ncbi:MAG: hypothetical protein JWO38_6990 [Gemmataceae bacterium]|nr:hypothetical protein [Gemmataceae bacterium]
MRKNLVIDEVHLTVRVPADLPDGEAEAVYRALTGKGFMARLRRAVREVGRGTPGLTRVRVSVSR